MKAFLAQLLAWLGVPVHVPRSERIGNDLEYVLQEIEAIAVEAATTKAAALAVIVELGKEIADAEATIVRANRALKD